MWHPLWSRPIRPLLCTAESSVGWHAGGVAGLRGDGIIGLWDSRLRVAAVWSGLRSAVCPYCTWCAAAHCVVQADGEWPEERMPSPLCPVTVFQCPQSAECQSTLFDIRYLILSDTSPSTSSPGRAEVKAAKSKIVASCIRCLSPPSSNIDESWDQWYISTHTKSSTPMTGFGLIALSRLYHLVRESAVNWNFRQRCYAHRNYAHRDASSSTYLAQLPGYVAIQPLPCASRVQHPELPKVLTDWAMLIHVALVQDKRQKCCNVPFGAPFYGLPVIRLPHNIAIAMIKFSLKTCKFHIQTDLSHFRTIPTKFAWVFRESHVFVCSAWSIRLPKFRYCSTNDAFAAQVLLVGWWGHSVIRPDCHAGEHLTVSWSE